MVGTTGAATITQGTVWHGRDLLNVAILVSLIIYPLLYAYLRRRLGKLVDNYRVVQAVLAGPNIPIAACMVIGVAFPSVRALVTDQGVFLGICGGIVIYTVMQAFWAD